MSQPKGIRLTDTQETRITGLEKTSSLRRADFVRAGFDRFLALPDSEIVKISSQFKVTQLSTKRTKRRVRSVKAGAKNAA